MAENYQLDELNLKQLAKRFLNVSGSRKKQLTFLLIAIMTLSSAYFIKTLMSPKYETETILKSNYLRKDQMNTILEKFNSGLADAELSSDFSAEFIGFLQRNYIIKFSASEIRPDITSADKNDTKKYYKLRTIYSQKPSLDNIEKSTQIIDKIREEVAKDHEIKIGIVRVKAAISDLDSLIRVATSAGANFNSRLSGMSSTMVVNDIYSSLNAILERKSTLQTELLYYENENLVYMVSPVVLSKVIKMPLIIFLIGFFVWIVLGIFWIGGVMIFGDE